MYTQRLHCQELLDALPSLAVRLDGRGRVAEVNRCFEAMTQWPRAEALGRDWFATFVPERERERIRGLFRRLLLGQASGESAGVILTRDGRELAVEWRSVLMADGGVACFCRAAEGGVKNEERLRQALEASAAELRRLADM